MNVSLHASVLFLVLLSGFLALSFRNLFQSIAALCLFNLSLALEFVVLGAPDVALAEAAVGAVLSVPVFVAALYACRKRTRGKGR